MEEDLQILNVEYLSHHLLDYTQSLDLSLNDQTIFYKSLKWRLYPKEDDLRCKDDIKACRIWLLSS